MKFRTCKCVQIYIYKITGKNWIYELFVYPLLLLLLLRQFK